MNILFLHNNNIDPNGGGISRITDVLARAFLDKGNQVYYMAVVELSTPTANPEQYYLPDQKNVYSESNLKYLKEFCLEKNISVIINQSALSMPFGRLMSEVPDVKRISVLHSSLFVPYRHTAYLLEYDLRKKGLGFLLPVLKMEVVNKIVVRYFVRKRKSMYKSMVNLCDAAVVLCQGQIDDFRLVLNDEEMKKLHIINNCIEPLTNKTVRTGRKKLVLWLGTIDFKIKRTDMMLRIWKKAVQSHPDWQLKILGDSPYAEEAKQLSDKMQIPQVEFVGRVNPELYYRESEIVCVTSTHECFCMVLLEALNYGVVPIAFDSFPAAKEEIVDNESGLLVPAFNIKQYANKLSNLMDNQEERMRLRQGALDAARGFDSSIIVEKWIDLINNL